jgi:hypothetical protein
MGGLARVIFRGGESWGIFGNRLVDEVSLRDAVGRIPLAKARPTLSVGVFGWERTRLYLMGGGARR